MKKGEYKNYRECPICGKTFPKTRKWFRRVNTKEGEVFHKICKACEDVIKFNKEWKNGKLRCHRCREYKSIDNFTAKGSEIPIRGYRRTTCKNCTNEIRKQSSLKWPDTESLIRCLNSRLLGAKDRARKQNIKFDLTLDFLLELWKKQNGKCALSGLPMTYISLKGRIPTNVSLDKIDRNLGYIKDNVQLVCMACNQMKSDLSEDLLYLFCKQIVLKYEKDEKTK